MTSGVVVSLNGDQLQDFLMDSSSARLLQPQHPRIAMTVALKLRGRYCCHFPDTHPILRHKRKSGRGPAGYRVTACRQTLSRYLAHMYSYQILGTVATNNTQPCPPIVLPGTVWMPTAVPMPDLVLDGNLWSSGQLFAEQVHQRKTAPRPFA